MTAEQLPQRVLWPADAAAQSALLNEAASRLTAGLVVALPTDTVYGLAALPASEPAMDALYALKGRPREKAIALLVAGPEALGSLALDAPLAVLTLAERYWPGGLTLVLKSAADPSTTIALRMPNHVVPLRLSRKLGSPLATTSANRSAAASPRTADDVLAQVPAGYPLLIDDGPCLAGVDSTVVDLSDEPGRLLREGAIGRAAIEAVTGPLG